LQDDKDEAYRRLKQSQIRWGAVYEWAAARGVNGLYKTAINPQVVWDYLHRDDPQPAAEPGTPVGVRS
jgi:hypothetical protein